MNYNLSVIAGNITRDLELRYTNNGMAVLEMTVAVNSGYGDKQKTAYVPVTCWGKTAEAVNQYCQKGSNILIEGYLLQDSWQDKTTGQNRSKIYLSASSAQFLDKKEKDPYGGDNLIPQGEPVHEPIQQPATDDYGYEVDNSDVMF